MTATSLIIGAAIRKENVTPSGIPDSTNPRKRGIAEQEQKGVTMPSIEAKTLPVNSDFPSSVRRVLSGVKKLRMTPTTKMIRTNSIKTFGTSNRKNRKASVRWFPAVNFKRSKTSQSVIGFRFRNIKNQMPISTTGAIHLFVLSNFNFLFS
jgi:hypothetical protein